MLTLVLALVGSGLWVFTRPGAGDPDRSEGSEPRFGEQDHAQVRVMLAGDSMTHGADGDSTWRFHLWNHLDPYVEGLDFVGPYTAPATQDEIIPPELFGGDADEGADSDEGGEEGGDRDGSEPGDRPGTGAEESPGGGSADGTRPDEDSGVPADGVAYRDPDFDQDHNARWGRTLADAAGTIKDDVATHQPDVLCVMIGINDLLYPITAEEMELRLRAYVNGARDANPQIRILFAEALPIALADQDEGFALRVYVYNELVRSVAADLTTGRSPVVSFDLAGAEQWDVAADTYDGTHPNDGGELKIAAGFADALSREFGLGPGFARPLPIRP